MIKLKLVFFSLFALISIVPLIALAQEPKVENYTYGVQLEILGIHSYTEIGLTRSIAVRCEAGFRGGVYSGSFFDNKTIYAFTPIFVVEPRFYYNLKRRVFKEKRIDNNTGNFLALKLAYQPSWFYISNVDVTLDDIVSVIPVWGLRRHIGKHFNYELGAGYGYSKIFNTYSFNQSGFHFHIHARAGYTF